MLSFVHLVALILITTGTSIVSTPVIVIGFLYSFDAFITTVNAYGRASLLRDHGVIRFNMPLPMEGVIRNAVVAACVDGEPCIAIAGYGKGAGIYLRHALSLDDVRSLPYEEDVYCVCINGTGTKLFFGTQSGWTCKISIGLKYGWFIDDV
jgi:hypothetical protein